jgi:hypothetical protein
MVAMFIDGIEFAGHSVLIALGVTIDGTKTPLGIGRTAIRMRPSQGGVHLLHGCVDA